MKTVMQKEYQHMQQSKYCAWCTSWRAHSYEQKL